MNKSVFIGLLAISFYVQADNHKVYIPIESGAGKIEDPEAYFKEYFYNCNDPEILNLNARLENALGRIAEEKKKEINDIRNEGVNLCNEGKTFFAKNKLTEGFTKAEAAGEEYLKDSDSFFTGSELQDSKKDETNQDKKPLLKFW